MLCHVWVKGVFERMLIATKDQQDFAVFANARHFFEFNKK